jgi:hypothetical protein
MGTAYAVEHFLKAYNWDVTCPEIPNTTAGVETFGLSTLAGITGNYRTVSRYTWEVASPMNG